MLNQTIFGPFAIKHVAMLAAAVAAAVAVAYASIGGEPSEDDMFQAFVNLRAVEIDRLQGELEKVESGEITDPKAASRLERQLKVGTTIRPEKLVKYGCTKPNDVPGYICDYTFTALGNKDVVLGSHDPESLHRGRFYSSPNGFLVEEIGNVRKLTANN